MIGRVLYARCLLASMLCFMLFTVGLRAQKTDEYPVFPKYTVLGVVYAPPGAASSVTYGNSTMVGASESINNSTNNTSMTTKFTSTGGGLFGLGATKTSGSSSGWMTSFSSTNTVSVQTTKGNSISTLGPISSSLGVNHDNDVIYILLNPIVSTQTTVDASGNLSILWDGINSNGCDISALGSQAAPFQGVAGCDPNQFPYPDIVGIPVWCLKNPYYPGQGCAQWRQYTSRAWDQSYWGPVGNPQNSPNPNLPAYPANSPGLTLQDYADILQADPFVALNGGTVNVCHPIYGPSFDPNSLETMSYPLTMQQLQASGQENATGRVPANCGGNSPLPSNRFQAYGSVQFPEPGPNGLPSTYTGIFSYSNTNQNIATTTDSHTVGSSSDVTKGFSNSFGWFGVNIASFSAQMSSGNSKSMTWQNTNTHDSQTQLTSTASYAITGPQLSDNYTGPATYNVYLDNIYGSYAFYSPLTPSLKLGKIAISPSALSFSAVPVGATSPSQVVTLTNNSLYPITMVSPAVTFDDPGFQIAQDGTDRCSNQYIAPYGTCTLRVVFAPVYADVPNEITQANMSNGQSFTAANMIAAGTENASAYQNVLVIAKGTVSGAVSGGALQGALLIADANASQGLTQDNPIPNVFLFGNSNAGLQVTRYTFTNHHKAGVTLVALPNQNIPVSVTDSGDFSIDPNSSSCTPGLQLGYMGYCSFNLTYSPQGSAIAAGNSTFGTGVSVSGYVNGYPAFAAVLATAGAIGTSSPGMTVSTQQMYVESQQCDPTGACNGGGGDQITVSNSGAASLYIAVDYSGLGRVEYPDSDGCSGQTIPGYGSCIITFGLPNFGPKTHFNGSFIISSGPYSFTIGINEFQFPYSGCTGALGYCSQFTLGGTTGRTGKSNHYAGGKGKLQLSGCAHGFDLSLKRCTVSGRSTRRCYQHPNPVGYLGCRWSADGPAFHPNAGRSSHAAGPT